MWILDEEVGVLMCSNKILAKSAAALIVMHGFIPSDLSIQKMNTHTHLIFSLWCLSLTPFFTSISPRILYHFYLPLFFIS